MYGFTNAIRTVDHAIVVLGFQCVRDLALSMAGAEMFALGSTAAEQRAALWQHALGCATVARLLADRTPSIPPNEAFLGGIFHDVGKLIFYDLVPDEYVGLTAGIPSMPSVELERQTFGLTHEEIGMRCAEDWRLPPTMIGAIGYHHHPSSAPHDQLFVWLIHMADRLARRWQVGSNEECVDGDPDVPEDIPLKLDAAAIEAVLATAPTEFQETARACTM